eukprot:3309927-Rhodomonas_salina.1
MRMWRCSWLHFAATDTPTAIPASAPQPLLSPPYTSLTATITQRARAREGGGGEGERAREREGEGEGEGLDRAGAAGCS